MSATSCTIRITCKDSETAVNVRPGLGMQAICARHKTPIEYDCREADCGICIFRVLKGNDHLSPPTPAEAEFLKAMHAGSNERLACQTRVFGDVEIEVETF